MTVRDSLYTLSAALQRRLAPGVQYSQQTYEARLKDQLKPTDVWLDIGCGHTVLPEWRGAEESALVRKTPFVVGIDMDLDALSRHRSITNLCQSNVSSLPFPNDTFDIVTANMVVEHLDAPAIQFAEIARVLKVGGLFMFHTPNLGSYLMPLIRMIPERVKPALARLIEGRPSEDVYPTHYRSNSPRMIEAAVAGTSLSLEHLEYVTSTPTFTVIPPLLVPELLLLRQLQRPGLARFRATIICRLRKTRSR